MSQNVLPSEVFYLFVIDQIEAWKFNYPKIGQAVVEEFENYSLAGPSSGLQFENGLSYSLKAYKR